MSNPKDQLVRKEKAKNTVKHLYGQGTLAICAAIDALTPEPVDGDPVSRKAMIKEWRAAVKRVHGRPYVDSDQLVLSVMKNLPSLPVPALRQSSGTTCRSEEEPDYEAMWKDVRQGALYAVPHFLAYKETIQKIEARHTPVEDSERSRTASAKPSGGK